MDRSEKKFNVTMPAGLHQTLKIRAALDGSTMNEFIIEALQEKLKREDVKKQMAAGG